MPLNDEARERFDRLETKLDRAIDAFQVHAQASGACRAETVQRFATLERDISYLHQDRRDRKAWFGALWLAVIGSLVASLWNYFTKPK